MKRIVFLPVLLLLMLCSEAQVKSGDAALDKRIAAYFRLNEQLDFAHLLDYIHPSLFKIAPREQIRLSFEQAFNNEDMTIRIDTIFVQSVGPAFISKGASYRRVDYSMGLTLRLRDTSMLGTEGASDQLLDRFKEAFAGKTTTYDAASHSFRIVGPDVLYAIRDTPATPWLFVGYQKNKELVEALFPKEVITHFGLL